MALGIAAAGVEIDNQRILDNVGALRLSAVPRSLAILGAGAVGTEFASLFAALSSRGQRTE